MRIWPKHDRRPPKPAFYSAPAGKCRMCGGDLLAKSGKPHRGRRWHNECGVEWRIASDSETARAALFCRDHGVCAMCGIDTTEYDTAERHVALDLGMLESRCRELIANRSKEHVPFLGHWHADHIYPLWLVDRTDPGALKRWGLSNLQTLCHSCHEFKTTQEAAQRAKGKRIRGETKNKKKHTLKSRPLTNPDFIKSPSGAVRPRGKAA